MHFDARAAKLLPPGGHIVVQGCPGLRLESSVTKKTWTYRYRSPVDGRLRQVKIGGWPGLSLAQAVSRWQELRDTRDAGRDPADEKKRARVQAVARAAARYTVGQMVEDYARGYLPAHREPKGAHAVAKRLRSAVADMADKPVDELTRGQVFELIEALSVRPVKAKSVKAEMAAACRYALDAGKLPENTPNWWAERLTIKLRSKGALREGRHKGTAKRVLTGDEIRTLLTTDLQLFSQQVQDFLVLHLWTCARGGEICQMSRAQVAQEATGLWWTIPKAALKTRHHDAAFDLRVPLIGRAEKVVRRLLEQSGDLLFPSRSRDGTIKPQSQAYMQSKVHYMQPYSEARKDHERQRLRVTHWSPHDLRRTSRTILASLKCPREVGEAILGHVVPGVAGDYDLYHYDAERREWLQALSQRLEALVSGAA